MGKPLIHILALLLFVLGGIGPASGQDAASFPAGTYKARLPAASGPGRDLTLTLLENRTATLTTDYRDGNAVREVGTWSAGTDGRVHLLLSGRYERQYEEPVSVLFSAEGGRLSAVEYSRELYGSEGLTLRRTGGDPSGESPAALRSRLRADGWQWSKTVYSNGDTVAPADPSAFLLQFLRGNRFSAATDCNTVTGAWAAVGRGISFDRIESTKMFCIGSQDSVFSRMLADTQGFLFTEEGNLVLLLKLEGGSVIFTPEGR